MTVHICCVIKRLAVMQIQDCPPLAHLCLFIVPIMKYNAVLFLFFRHGKPIDLPSRLGTRSQNPGWQGASWPRVLQVVLQLETCQGELPFFVPRTKSWFLWSSLPFDVFCGFFLNAFASKRSAWFCSETIKHIFILFASILK